MFQSVDTLLDLVLKNMIVRLKADDAKSYASPNMFLILNFLLVLCSRWFKSAGGVAGFENFRETLHGHRSVSFEVMRTM